MSFVEISTLDVLKDGTVYVLDTKDSRVKVFDAKGKFLRAFGKAGQGPGEMNRPVGILITPENEVLVEDAGLVRPVVEEVLEVDPARLPARGPSRQGTTRALRRRCP